MSNLASYFPAQAHIGDSQHPQPQRRDLRDFMRFLAALWRRRALVAVVTGGCVALVALFTMMTPKSYFTTAVLLAGNPSANTNGSDAGTTLPVLNALVLRSGVQSAETFAALAQQEDVARDVARKLRLRVSAGALLGRLTVKPVPNTALLNVTASWKNPQGAANITNAFADAFTARERDFVRAQADAAIRFLTPEIPRAEARMQQTAQELAHFEATKGYTDGASHTQDVVARAGALDAKIDTLALDAREQQALLDNAQRQVGMIPSSIDSAKQISANPVAADLRAKLSNVQVQLASAQDQYTDSHPLVISLKRQRDELVNQIAQQPQNVQSGDTLAPNPIYQSLQEQVAQYRQHIDGDNAQLALARQQRAALAPLLSALPKDSIELATIQQRAKLASDVYNALQQKYNDARIASTTAISDVTVIQAASADAATKWPNVKINLVVAFIVGFLLSAIAIFILEAIDHSVRDASDAHELTGLPIIGRIPKLSNASPKALPWLQSMTVEAFFQLCIALRLKDQRDLRVMAITSPSRGDGKSTIAFNLAKTMATLTSGRILLIDADLRRPTLHEIAGVQNLGGGLTRILSDSRTISEVVIPLSKSWDLLPAGPGSDNPIGLIESEKFVELLEAARAKYSMVIVDTPALGSVGDALLVSARADATVLVVSANVTNETHVKDVIAQFSAVGIGNLVGIVLNRDTKRVEDYGDYFARGPAALPSGQ